MDIDECLSLSSDMNEVVFCCCFFPSEIVCVCVYVYVCACVCVYMYRDVHMLAGTEDDVHCLPQSLPFTPKFL